ncbi:MAG: FAD-dependent oxidoreductase [Acidobacteria bacterium]|nr:FAD-dependent oxidoreductase [Acidobacteriota bacterium]
MPEPLGSAARPLRVAIIGAGPAGYYTAEALLKNQQLHCAIDLFNRFPSPFGLVRDGVAPDHQTIKSVTRIYDKISQDPRLRYFGNVTFGTDVSHDELKHLYDQIVYAVGAQADRRMNIPGEDLLGSHPATEFVGWYNGRPDYRDLEFNLSHERVLVVGNGNVAMDVARILATLPEELAKTDIADYALEKLRHSKVREVIMLGRRGPEQAAFTTPELKEFGELAGVNIVVDPQDLELDQNEQVALIHNKMAERNMEVLRQYAALDKQNHERTIRMRFFVSPVELLGENGRLTHVKIERNQLVMDTYGGLRAKGTGVFETIEAGMILRSVGYRSVPLQGVPFDDVNFKIPNVAGRVMYQSSAEFIPGEYVVGWAKRGPNGVIGTNKPDAVATVASMLEDLNELEGIADDNRDLSKIETLLQSHNIDYVNYADWKKLDDYELKLGAEQHRPRVKVASVTEMLHIIRG